MKVISLKDYAAEKGISYEAVRQQVVRYKEELDPHIIRDGRQQFLDEEAVAFLDSKRQKNPMAIIQMDKNEQIEALEEQVKQLLVKTAAQADRISELAQWKADNAVAIAQAHQTQLLLDNAQRDVKLLEGFVADAKAEITVLTSEKITLQGDYAQAAEALERMREEATQRLQEAEAAEQRELEASEKAKRVEKRNQILEEYAAACREYNALPRLKRMFRDPPAMPELQEK